MNIYKVKVLKKGRAEMPAFMKKTFYNSWQRPALNSYYTISIGFRPFVHHMHNKKFRIQVNTQKKLIQFSVQFKPVMKSFSLIDFNIENVKNYIDGNLRKQCFLLIWHCSFCVMTSLQWQGKQQWWIVTKTFYIFSCLFWPDFLQNESHQSSISQVLPSYCISRKNMQ